MTAPTAPEWRTIDEIAVVLRCSRGTVLREIQRGNLRATKVAARYLIQQSDLQSYLDGGFNIRAS